MAARDHRQGISAAAQLWGAVPTGDGLWNVAFWAPSAREVVVDLHGEHLLHREEDGTFRGTVRGHHGDSYAFVTDGLRMADPASRWQKDGEEGPSRLLDQARLTGRPGPERPLDEAVIAELHIGSFTPEGTFAAAARAPQLQQMADLGITMIELMPVGQFPGQRGWGYDVILPWAPHCAYGPPEDLRLLVDAAHSAGMQVCLDVVFNHFGPEGCRLVTACPEFFHDHSNDWGRAINFARPEVHDFYAGCTIWWLETYGIDALRFDALNAIADDSPGMIEDLARRIRAHPFGRTVHLMGEDSRNTVAPYHPDNRLFHAVWNDDLHHAQHVLLTGETFGYYRGFRHQPLQDMAKALREGFVLQGQPRPGTDERKGEPSALLPPQSLIAFNLNHDHAGNRPRGDRLLSLIGTEKALVAHALLLTSPSVPLLFMGEEIGSEAPFAWFADYEGDMAATMLRERSALFEGPDAPPGPMADPFDPETLVAACPYLVEPPEADRWKEVTRALTALRRRLLPVYRSGRVALPEVRIAAPSALSVRFDFRDGSVTSIACFDPADRIAGADRPAPLFRLGEPGSPPFFALWLDPAETGSAAIQPAPASSG